MTTKAPGPAEVLLVEDDRALSSEMAAYLASQGYTVHQAGDATEARRVLTSRPVAVVVLDPSGVDGASLYREVADKCGPSILALSALDQRAQTASRCGAGRHAHAAKPISAHELLSRVSAMARRRRSTKS